MHLKGVFADMELEKLKTALDYLGSRITVKPAVGIILGSGLGALAAEVDGASILNYKSIPGFPLSTVPGHEGRLVVGRLGNVPVMVMQGRFHYYEGYDMGQVTYPVRVMAGLGIKKLVVTNAAGGLNPFFQPGDLMLLRDHLNFMGENPLRGPNLDELGPRFPSLGEVYDPIWREKTRQLAASRGVLVREGVYLAVSGPTYETAAEVRAFQLLGADAVGMSTVPEIIVAAHGGMKVLAISCITNMAAGLAHSHLEHSEVVQAAQDSAKNLRSLVLSALEVLPTCEL